jgi:plasmid replication initiation protein
MSMIWVIIMQAKSKKKHGTIVKIHNDLARAHWSTDSIWEMRIISVVASLIQETDNDFCTYRIPLSALGVAHLGRNYSEIKQAIVSLVRKVVIIKGERKNFMAYTIFDKCGYENGYLIAGFHPDLKPFFQGLKKRFTLYPPDEILRLSSIYSQRLYMLLKSWLSCPKITFKIDELHEILCVPVSLKNKYSDFRRKVLEQAHSDIQDSTSLRFNWIPIKVGRAVKEIQFIFTSPCLQSESEIEQHALMQKESNACFERHLSLKSDCKPQTQLMKCQFCLSRGRMYAKNLSRTLSIEVSDSVNDDQESKA